MLTLDPRLENDTFDCGAFTLCRLLLLNDSRYPWFILVPQRPGITEIHQLNSLDRQLFWEESHHLSLWMEKFFTFDKLNVAALGNIVRQLHLHHVGRCVGDPAWPGPVWGHSAAVGYERAAVTALKKELQAGLAGLLTVEPSGL